MLPLKRHVEIDYSKYAPDIKDPEVMYGLPKEVQFCNSCVMSNQKPNSCQEFQHTIASVKQSMHIDGDGVCDRWTEGRGQNFVDADGDGVCDNWTGCRGGRSVGRWACLGQKA